jgi:hypothetical protein
MPATAAQWDFDPSDDFLIADGIETVELRRLKADGTYEAAVDCRAVREPMNKKTVAGQMEAADLVFHLHGPDVGAAGVRGKDKLTDAAGVEWAVSNPSLAGVVDQWRCPVTKIPARSA